MEYSKLPLKTWVLGIYFLTTNPKGISSNKLAEYLDVSQKKAWLLAHKIREGCADAANIGKLDGTLEADETYVGGLEKKTNTGTRSCEWVAAQPVRLLWPVSGAAKTSRSGCKS